MRKLMLLLPVFLLAACEDNSRPPSITTTFEVDGCEVKYVNPPNYPNFYIARCGNTTTSTWQQKTGKSTTTYGAVNVESADELRKKLAEVETRDKALAKLTPEDRKALGIK